MMQQRWLSSLLVILSAITLPTFGQSLDLHVKIPFPFNVGQAQLPAGDYVLSSTSDKIAIRDSQGKTVAMALANRGGRQGTDNRGKAMFECYSDRCFLSQFWTTGEKEGAQLVRSSLETKIAAKQTGQYFAVMASPARQ
jgi:hypothetical protein